MNRRDFLLSTSSLLAAPLPTLAQERTQPASASGDIVFANFESGTYDGWTLTGSCWGDAPASGKTLGDAIKGIQGSRFLCSFHPKLGGAATGKAVSKEFTIEKPFINFLIGGGKLPGESCINLLVDGKVVRTETGNV